MIKKENEPSNKNIKISLKKVFNIKEIDLKRNGKGNEDEKYLKKNRNEQRDIENKTILNRYIKNLYWPLLI